jgi:hypothetical protein
MLYAWVRIYSFFLHSHASPLFLKDLWRKGNNDNMEYFGGWKMEWLANFQCRSIAYLWKWDDGCTWFLINGVWQTSH